MKETLEECKRRNKINTYHELIAQINIYFIKSIDRLNKRNQKTKEEYLKNCIDKPILFENGKIVFDQDSDLNEVLKSNDKNIEAIKH